jgi:peptide/nickel transport system permease protein
VAEIAERLPAVAVAERPSTLVGLRNWQLVGGLSIVLGLAALGLVGSLLVGTAGLKLGSAGFVRPPSLAQPFGTDSAGRDVFTFWLHAILPTLEIGVIAGGVGTIVGVLFGLVTGYMRGPLDSVIRTAADVAMSVPALAVLIVISSYVRFQSIELMALIVALFAWPYPTRNIRAQTLSLREQAFVQVARLSGKGELKIAFTEILPNLLPYVIAGFVGSVFGGILASVGLQLLGLGPRHIPTLGLMLEESFQAGALIRNLWWWWGAPCVTLILLFLGLFMISLGLDHVANPRLRRRGRM